LKVKVATLNLKKAPQKNRRVTDLVSYTH